MTLKDQLKSIADTNKSLGGYTHSKATLRKASLIFTEREAADLDNDTVFDIGFRGRLSPLSLGFIFVRRGGEGEGLADARGKSNA